LHREELLRRLDRAGLVDYQRALAALQDRAQAGKPAEEALVSAGLVSEVTLTRLIADSYRIPFMSLADRYVSSDVARLVPRDVAENYALLPIEREGETLTLAMADPMDLMAEDLVRFMTSCQIRRVMVPRSELLQALAAAYDGGTWPLGSPEDPVSSQVELRGEGSVEAVPPGLATTLILEALREEASDLHFEPRESGLAVRFRIDGRLQKSVDLGVEQRSAVLAELRRLTDFSSGDWSAPRLGRCHIRTPELEADLTVASMPCLHGHKVVLRLLDRSRQAPNLERLGFLPETFRHVVSLLEKSSGLILVTGPAGSGRTSTSYGMLHHLGPQGRSIVALEDSWMPELAGITCIPVGTEPGTMGLKQALEGALLQDPDVLLLRGLPDRETTDLVLRAAGEMLVITTMGAEGALAAVQNLQRLAGSPWRAVSSLLGVVAQRRVRRLCEACREEVPSEEGLDFSLPHHLKLPERRFRGRGCRACSYSGYRDRVGLQEVLVISERLRHLLWSGASEQRLLETALVGGVGASGRRWPGQGRRGPDQPGRGLEGAASDSRGREALPYLPSRAGGGLPGLPLLRSGPGTPVPVLPASGSGRLANLPLLSAQPVGSLGRPAGLGGDALRGGPGTAGPANGPGGGPRCLGPGRDSRGAGALGLSGPPGRRRAGCRRPHRSGVSGPGPGRSPASPGGWLGVVPPDSTEGPLHPDPASASTHR